MKKLTATQQKAFDFIWQHIEKEGFAPTLRELCDYMNYNAIGSAQDMIACLRRKDYLRTPSKRSARSFVLSEKGLQAKEKSTQNKPKIHHISPANMSSINQSIFIPCLGSVPAGNPMEAIETPTGHLHFNPTLLPKPTPSVKDLFALKADGLSMIDAGICDGDWLVVKKQESANIGQIIVARIDSDVTVKRLMKDDRRGWYLKPENRSFSPIYADENPFVLIGQVIALQRSFSS